MTTRTSKKIAYGDYCFREPHLGRTPLQIRQDLAERARLHIGRSMAKAPRFLPAEWHWVRTGA
jgi:hypothetical protein